MLKTIVEGEIASIVCSHCNRPVSQMCLLMSHRFDLAEIDRDDNTINFAEDGWVIETRLLCRCGHVYAEDKDYEVKWHEDDTWTLDVIFLDEEAT